MRPSENGLGGPEKWFSTDLNYKSIQRGKKNRNRNSIKSCV